MKWIELFCGRKTAVDDADHAFLSSFSWCFSKGYAVTGKPHIRMHRMIMGCSPRDGREVDHVNGDRLDNRRENLRVTDRSGNQQNKLLGRNNKSGFKGVFWHKSDHCWKAQIKCKGRIHYLGSFSSTHEAAHAYNKAAVVLHGEFAVLNPVGRP